MPLYHITNLANEPGIRKRGLLTARSRGMNLCVWCCSGCKLKRVWDHLQWRHGWRPADMIVLAVTVPRWSRKRGWRGVWKAFWDITPARIGPAFTLQGKAHERLLLSSLG